MAIDLDRSGHGFQRVRTYLGPSLGWVDELVQPTVEITTAGTYNVQPGNSYILVDVAGPVVINLPDVVKWVQQTAYQPATGFDRSITVKDLGGNAANFNIVVAPFGQQAIDNIQQAIVVSTARTNVRLSPLIDLTGWSVETSSIGTGGGGGGDVFKAGNNTYTGINTFNNTITALTRPAADSTQNVATTAFVKLQNYITGAALTPYALIASPIFTGNPQAPTPAPSADDASIATVGFVENAIATLPGVAPASAGYVTSAANATLTNERVLANSTTITWDFTVPGQAKANTVSGGGNVTNVGVPVSGEYARWTTATSIQGVGTAELLGDIGAAPVASPIFTGDPRAPTPATGDNDTTIATTAFVKAQGYITGGPFQPLDGDLTSLSALAGTNTIYYRSGIDVWSPVVIGTGLSFSGGTLVGTGGGGGIPEAPSDSLYYARRNLGWSDIAVVFAPLVSPVFTGDPTAPTPVTADNDTSIATTAFVKAQGYITTIAANAAFQPLDADLTSLAAASSVDAIYYRSAANTWGPVTIGANLTFSGGTLTATGGGGGNVSAIGTPTTGQFARWTGATTIEGLTPAATLTAIGGQPTDGDLTALSGLTGTNTIYYRSATDIWSPVTFSGLSFSGGILTVTAGGGNVSNTGTPVNDQIAVWTGANVIEGTSNLTFDTTTLHITSANTALEFNATGASPDGFSNITFKKNGIDRWYVEGTNNLETGGNTGSDFAIWNTNDAGAFGSAPALGINRATSKLTVLGDLSITKATPTIQLNKSASGQDNGIYGQNGGLNRWLVDIGNSTPESGSNAGSDFQVDRFSDVGALLGTPLSINRATGVVTIQGQTGPFLPLAGGALSGNLAITSSSINALAVGPAGTTNPTLNVYAANPSAVTGLQVVSSAVGTGTHLQCLSSATNENIHINAKGTGATNIKGTGTNDNAPTGVVGEYITSSIAFPGVTISTSATATNMTSITLTAGDWDVWLNMHFVASVGVSRAIAAIPTVSASLGAGAENASVPALLSGTYAANEFSIIVMNRRLLSATTTIFAVGYAVFASGTVGMFGDISARRRR